MTTHEVISAFVDNEPFDAEALSTALADPAGRELLIDLVALRQLVEPGDERSLVAATPASRSRSARWWIASAAAVVLAMSGGFFAGRQVETTSADGRISGRASGDAAAPAPTVVVRLGSDAAWQPVQKGASR